MPIVYREQIADGWLALWKITESADTLRGLVNEQDARESYGFKSLSRQREWLAWRAVVCELLDGAKVGYDSAGAPQLIDKHGFIGVSHEHDFAAVIHSPTQRCAIDIEDRQRNFERVAAKYISEVESELPDSDHRFFKAAVWCAKETVYKYEGVSGVDFQKDISVESSDLDAGVMRATLKGLKPINLALFLYEKKLIVYTLLK